MGIFNPPSSGGGGGGGVTSVNTRTGAVTLAASDILSGTFDIARIPVVPSQKQVVSSGTIAQLTTAQQAEIGQGTIVTTTDGRRWVYTGTGSKVLEASYITLADVSPDWNAIDNKPTSFTPSTHASSHAAGGLDAITPASIGASASPQVDIFKVTGGINSFTWTKPANAKQVVIECVAGGGGGGAGIKVAANIASSGGGSGGSGGYTRVSINGNDLPNTEIYTALVGTGGAGGTAGGVAGGVSGTNSSVSGNNIGIFASTRFGGGGGAGQNGANSTGGISGLPQGAGGIGGTSGAAGSTTGSGGAANYGPSSGGSGGGTSATTPFQFAGGASSNNTFTGQAQASGGIAGGGAGGVSVLRPIPSLVINGGGGGGGGSSISTNGGDGGNAVGFGGGGGGGGSCSSNDTALRAGNGGRGGDGIVVITSYF